jgi:hypothetical protein
MWSILTRLFYLLMGVLFTWMFWGSLKQLDDQNRLDTMSAIWIFVLAASASVFFVTALQRLGH